MDRKGRAGGALIVALVCGWPVLTGATASAAAPRVTGRADDAGVIVAFTPGTTSARASSVIKEIADAPTDGLRGGARVVHVEPAAVASTIAALRARPEVRYAEPNGVVRAALTPNDPSYAQLWGMTKIGAPTAWGSNVGDSSAVAAVIDTGVDATHPDLAPNMWHNPGAVWGCPAGTTGFDVVNGDCNPADDHYHGTHVAGTIGAVGDNGIGVAGVSWNVKVMALKVLDASGEGTDADVAIGIDDAVLAKEAGANVRVINMSLGGPGGSSVLQDAIARANAAGIVVVAAAGNTNTNVDQQPYAPCIYATLCVAATATNDHRASFSSYGATTVDIAAPGVNTYSTAPGGSYATLSGTSMATPHVAGAIALLAQSGLCRNWSASQLTSLVLAQSDTLSGLNVAGNRRLNVAKAMTSCTDPTDFALAPTSTTLAVVGGESVTTTISSTPTTPPQNVALSASGLPTGAAASFDPPTITTGGSATLTISSAPTATTGVATVAVTATGAVTRTTSIALSVIPGATTLTNGAPLTVSGASGSDQYFRLDVLAGQPSLGFVTTNAFPFVDMYVHRGSPPTLGSFDCASLIVYPSSGCPFVNPAAGTWYVLLHARAAFTGVTLLGRAPNPNDFSIDVSPAAATIIAGGSAAATITTEFVSGFARTVALSTSGLPPGATASFASSSVNAGTGTTLNITTTTGVAPGTYPISVVGMAGAVVHTAPFTLTIPVVSALANNVPVSVSGAAGSTKYWKINVPGGSGPLRVNIGGGTGDVDVSIAYNRIPTDNDNSCNPKLSGNNESCIVSPTTGTWYVALRGVVAYATVTLSASYATLPGTALVNGKYVRNLSGAAGTDVFYKLTVPAGRSKLVLASSGGTGNADLYMARDAQPSLTSYACRSIKKANADSCTVLKPVPGVYYVMVHGTAAYAKLSLHGTYTPK